MEQKEMTRQEQHDIVYRRCICEYGTQPQIDMCIEEMSELTKALLFQAEDEVERRIDFKVDRQLKRLEG